MSPGTESPEFAVRVESLDKVYRINQSLPQRRWGRGATDDPVDDDDDDDVDAVEEDEEEAQVVTARRVEALRDLSFEVGPGEKFGIVGFTGSGKTTLLKVLGRIAPPTAGQVTMARPVAPPAPALTGLFGGQETVRQNLRHMADLLRVDREAMLAAEPEMLAFAGLETHRDIAMKRWASGFAPRLSAAMVLHMGARVLLSEGNPAWGEPGFRERCEQRIDELVAGGATMVMTCGDPKSVRLCSSAIWLDEGRLRMQGSGEEVAEQFERHLLTLDLDELDPRVAGRLARMQGRQQKIDRAERKRTEKVARVREPKSARASGSGSVQIKSAVALTGDGRPARRLNEDDTLQLELTLDAPEAGRLRGRAILVLDEGRTRRLGHHFETVLESAGEIRATIDFPARQLPVGELKIDVSAMLGPSGEVASERITIEVFGEQPTLGEVRELAAREWALSPQR